MRDRQTFYCLAMAITAAILGWLAGVVTACYGLGLWP